MHNPIEIFTGVVTDIEARVYARFRGAVAGERIELSGQLRGPYCEHARTLAAEVAFRNLGPGPTTLAEAVIPDPCSWSPELPHWYEAEVEARASGRAVGGYRGMFGIRRFATRGASFVLDGKRWVIRGARRASVIESPLAEWRAARMAMLVRDPSDELCEAASREGVMLLAELRANEENNVGDELHRLARWPAVAIVELLEGASTHIDVEVSKPPGLILARKGGASESGMMPAWVDALLRDDASIGALSEGVRKPVIVTRFTNEPATLAEARGYCDALQGDLASTADFAGYLV